MIKQYSILLIAILLLLQKVVFAESYYNDRNFSGARLYSINEKWDENLLRAKFYVDYLPKYDDLSPADAARTYNLTKFIQPSSPFTAPNVTAFSRRQEELTSGSDIYLSDTQNKKAQFVVRFQPVLKEYIGRLMVNGRFNKASGKDVYYADRFPIIYQGNGRLLINYKVSGVENDTFNINGRISSLPRIAKFLKCHVNNGVSTTERLKADCVRDGTTSENNINDVDVSIDMLSKKIAEIGFCFGLDPIAFTGMLYQETNFYGSKRKKAGTGFTQMTSIGILETERHLNWQEYRAAGLKQSTSGTSEAENEAILENVNCYSPGWRKHTIPIAASDIPALRQDPVTDLNLLGKNAYINNVKKWLIGDYDKQSSFEVLLDRQLIYGAVFKKGKLTRALFTGRDKATEASYFKHYERAAKAYNGNPDVVKTYAKNVISNYPSLMGLEAPSDGTYDCDYLFPKHDRFILNHYIFDRSHPRCYVEMNLREI